ncbi:hypothetical protein MJO29_000381, partial [Puccinia striiformis f. sp. tritici]
ISRRFHSEIMEWILSVGVRKLLQDKVIERRRLEEKNLREEVLTQGEVLIGTGWSSHAAAVSATVLTFNH